MSTDMSAATQEPDRDAPGPPGPDPADAPATPLPLRRYLKRLPALPLD